MPGVWGAGEERRGPGRPERWSGFLKVFSLESKGTKFVSQTFP